MDNASLTVYLQGFFTGFLPFAMMVCFKTAEYFAKRSVEKEEMKRLQRKALEKMLEK